jgi:hypothetical protein
MMGFGHSRLIFFIHLLPFPLPQICCDTSGLAGPTSSGRPLAVAALAVQPAEPK